MTEEEFRKGSKQMKNQKTKGGSNIALKDYHLFCPPEVDVQIKKGDDVKEIGVPENLIGSLITEQVLKG